MQNFFTATVLRLIGGSLIFLSLIWLLQLLYTGISTRMKFRRMQKQGLVGQDAIPALCSLCQESIAALRIRTDWLVAGSRSLFLPPWSYFVHERAEGRAAEGCPW